MIDHITVQIEKRWLHSMELDAFLTALGFMEIDAFEEIKEGWDVRWFIHHYPSSWQSPMQPISSVPKPELHLVADDDWPDKPVPALSHFCLVGVGSATFEMARESEWNEHDREGSGRTWLNFYGLRIEVRP